MRLVAAVGAAMLTVAVLAGCAEPAPAPVPSASPGLPAGFPPSVPVLPHRVLRSGSTTDQWSVRVASRSVLADYRAARGAIVAAGFSTTVDNVSADSGQGQFCDARYCIGVDAGDDPDAGPSVGYEVWVNTGLDAPRG